MHFFLVFLY